MSTWLRDHLDPNARSSWVTLRARRCYADVLGAALYREYGGTSAVSRFAGAWLLLVTGGGPTEDEPDVRLAPRADPATLSHLMTIRVPDCRAAHDEPRRRGAQFLSPPKDWGAEIRCFFRDPDRHLFRTSEASSGSLPVYACRHVALRAACPTYPTAPDAHRGVCVVRA